MQERPGHAPGLLRVAVLGGYGLIGASIMDRLAAAGHKVEGIGRSKEAAARSPHDDWHFLDIGSESVETWQSVLADIDVVVNAAGALQDGAKDSLTAIHETALMRLAEALQSRPVRIVQISAAGVAEDASTAFFRTKARGEAALRRSGVSLVILRPTLVLAPTAYGGTALLRAGAAIPYLLPKVLPEATVQCVHVEDLAEATLAAVDGRLKAGTEVDVTGAGTLNLPDLLRKMRRWLGVPDPVATVPVPKLMLRLISLLADLTGRFGWRSPLRSTALQVLADGIRGDPEVLRVAGGPECRDLDTILRTLPATTQDRWFARAFLMLPLAIVALSLFWLASGLIGLWQLTPATEILTSRGLGRTTALIAVVGGGLLDILLGLAILFRRWARRACLGMIALALAYLVSATLFTPDLWLDPLGPLVKVLPTIVLTFFTLAFLDER